jgi:hypothetical protein
MYGPMFRIVRIAALAGVALFAAGAAAQNAASPVPATLTQAVAATMASKADYAFEYQLETSKTTWRARFSPRTSPRLALVQPRREELADDERRAFDNMAESMEGVSWCASEGMSRADNVRLVREDANSAVYSFQPNAETIRGEQARRFANRLRGEFTLTKANPDISRIRIYTPQSFSPMLMVRVDEVNVVISCTAAPNGRRYAAETVTTMRGSALGQDFNERSVQRAVNLVAP